MRQGSRGNRFPGLPRKRIFFFQESGSPHLARFKMRRGQFGEGFAFALNLIRFEDVKSAVPSSRSNPPDAPQNRPPPRRRLASLRRAEGPRHLRQPHGHPVRHSRRNPGL